jgi:hypothetical protein
MSALQRRGANAAANTTAAPPAQATEIALPGPDSQEPESIFTGPVSDTVLGDSQQPQVEMPTAANTETFAAPSEPDADLTQFKPRPIYTGSVLTMYAFIFLIPYAILATAAIVYLLVMRPAPIHPLDLMPDPASNPKAGGAKSVNRTPHKQRSPTISASQLANRFRPARTAISSSHPRKSSGHLTANFDFSCAPRILQRTLFSSRSTSCLSNNTPTKDLQRTVHLRRIEIAQDSERLRRLPGVSQKRRR